MKRIIYLLLIMNANSTSEAQQKIEEKLPGIVLVKQHPLPVITIQSKGSEDIKYGFEGGTAVKINDTYHLFTSEMSDDPFWVKMRHGYWTSKDRIHWKRVSTIRESSGEFEGKDARASLWSPMVFWHEEGKRWNMFYVAYHAAPNADKAFRWNEKGRIYRSVSERPGKEGIAGPYKDVAIIMKPGKDSDSWEGLQGTDSFYPWKVGKTWYAFYGSSKSERMPVTSWLVGYAMSRSLKGPWKRLSSLNPSTIEKRFIENPIVTKLKDGGWLCIYDNDKPDAMGWSYSADGINWSEGQSLVIQPNAGHWSKDVRTVLGLIEEGNNKYTIFYSGFEQSPNWSKLLKGQTDGLSCAIGFVEIEIQ